MSQSRQHYLRKSKASTSLTVDKAMGEKVQTEAKTTETPLTEQPHGVHEEEGEFWPLSGKPYFDVIITKSHLGRSYQMNMPTKIQKELPCATVPVVVTYRGKKWETVYCYCNYNRSSRRLERAGWKKFAVDNNLKIGDACVFELVESSNDGIRPLPMVVANGKFCPFHPISCSKGAIKVVANLAI